MGKVSLFSLVWFKAVHRIVKGTLGMKGTDLRLLSAEMPGRRGRRAACGTVWPSFRRFRAIVRVAAARLLHVEPGLLKFIPFTLGIGLWIGSALSASAALDPGDIAIIGFNSDNDAISFVALVDIPAGEVLYFTDNGWLDEEDGALRTTEDTIDYTVPEAGMTAGSIVNLDPVALGLSASGDQVLAYQGSAGSLTFIYAVNFQGGTGVWQTGLDTSNDSALPKGLTNGTTAVALIEKDNGAFDTSVITSGTKANWLAAIGNTAHWVTSNESMTLPGAAESITVTSSGIDLRAFQTLEGAVVEFAAYDVEADGEIRLVLLDESGSNLWSGTVEVATGPEVYARIVVPGLEMGKAYDFRLRDEVGKWWDAPGITVQPFAAEMVSASLEGIELTVDSQPDHDYEIQWIPALGREWQAVTNFTAAGTKTTVVVPHPGFDNPAGFFRVQLK